MLMKKLLIVEPLDKKIVEDKRVEWKKHGFQVDYLPDQGVLELGERLAIGKYDALIVRNMQVTAKAINQWVDAMPLAQLAIIRAGSNISTIDIESATNNSIFVMNTPGANSQAVAQFVVSQLFLLTIVLVKCI